MPLRPSCLSLVVAAPLFILSACSGGSDDGGTDGDATTDETSSETGSDASFDARGDTLDGQVDARADATHDGAKDATDASDARVDTFDATPVDSGPSSARQVAKPLGTTAAGNGYWEYLPPTYADGTPHPLLVFWHGVGEDGDGSATGLTKLLAHGPPKLISKDEWPADRPFVVLSPQHAGSGCPSATEIHDFMTFALGAYHVDGKNVFLTGLSCGAIGSWSYINQYLDAQIAAAVLMSGDPGDPTKSGSAWGHDGCNLGKVAIWALHGDADTTVPIADEKTTMTDLLACPAPPRRPTQWTVLAGAGHDIWDPIYDLTDGYMIYDFLLANPHP